MPLLFFNRCGSFPIKEFLLKNTNQQNTFIIGCWRDEHTKNVVQVISLSNGGLSVFTKQINVLSPFSVQRIYFMWAQHTSTKLCADSAHQKSTALLKMFAFLLNDRLLTIQVPNMATKILNIHWNRSHYHFVVGGKMRWHAERLAMNNWSTYSEIIFQMSEKSSFLC